MRNGSRSPRCRPRTNPRGRARMSARPLVPTRVAPLLIALLASMAACDGPGVVSADAPRFGRVGTASSSVEFVGTWRRAIFFLDDFGIARSSETTWQFGTDGSVSRVLVARNLTFGLADIVVSAGRYRVENARLLIDFITPAPSQLAFDVRRTGDQLFIAGEPYLRVNG